MVKLYHKLVRDRIPEIIAAQGKTCVTEVLDDGAYLAMLKEKLAEECAEVRAAMTEDEILEELADVLEVVYAIGAAHGCGRDGLEEIRQKKKTERGAFAARILLTEVGESTNVSTKS
ncbi:MAG: nucleoside triphosphate pyrophosphohydrolase [Clostridia bacterium]|nr:nucleoside triphosphate pyrophosphohydrolase [Clostridia bacterium]